MTIEVKSPKKQPRKTKTIYKKTLTKVYKYVLAHKRTEIKVAARELGLNRESVRMALHILTKAKFIRERKYKDIGVSYFYPCEDRLLFIYWFCRNSSYLIVLTSKLELYYMLRYPCFSNMMPDDCLHHFLKRTHLVMLDLFGEEPKHAPYVALPGEFNKKTGRVESKMIPELMLIEPISFVRSVLRDNRTKVITYDIRDIYNPLSKECQERLGILAFEATFIRNKKKIKTENKTSTSDE